MMVKQGLGLAVLPALAAQRPPLSELAFRPLTQPVSWREIGLIRRADLSPRPAEARLAKLVSDAVPGLIRSPHVNLSASA